MTERADGAGFAEPVAADGAPAAATERSGTLPPPLQPRRRPTCAQLVNAGKLLGAVAASYLTRRAFVWGAPAMLMVEPATLCQLHCPHCPTGRGELNRPGGRISLADFRRIWDSLRPPPLLLQLWNQGEPLVNPDTPAIIRHAVTAGTKVTLSTNVEPLVRERLAERIVRSGLHTLILSLDGATAESHSAYRVGGDFTKVERGIRNVVETKRRLGLKHPRLQWQFLLFRHNLSERKLALRHARSWGVDEVVFNTAQLESLKREQGERWLPDDENLRRYVLRGNRWELKRRPRPFCTRIFASAVVQWDGTVVPCCFDKDGRHSLGNAISAGFPEVWRSGRYRAFRRRILSGTRPEMCANCTEGLNRLYAETHRTRV
ncbi:MAG: putative mycofactocin radical SAM maturase MftC [Calditrichaeota bacterium]|nr:putative mycofactocin radical SAM maturase MftC [Calditrichota bacterium]